MPVPGAVNTADHDEGFPWMTELPGDGLHLFFNRGSAGTDAGPVQVLDALWDGAAWAAPEIALEAATPSGLPGSILTIALPSVSTGDFGTELSFVYVVALPDGNFDFQIGVAPRL